MSDSRKDIKTISNNIAVLEQRRSVCEEQLNICFRQMVRTLCMRAGELSVESAYEELCRAVPSPTNTHKVLFCKHIAGERRFAQSHLLKYPFGEGEGALPGTHGHIAYMRNERGDAAFSRLSKARRGAKAHYASSFSAACESVWENASEFCIIPIENSASGRLYSFYAMLDRYELKICDTVLIEGEDGSDGTLFALAGRNIELGTAKTAPRRFEFSVVHSSAGLMGDIIAAAAMLGGRLHSVGTQPLAYDERQSRCYFAVDFDVASPVPLSIYLGLEYSGYTPIGLYLIKEQGESNG